MQKKPPVRSVIVQFRLTPEEAKDLNQVTKKSGLKRSNLLRRRLLETSWSVTEPWRVVRS